MQQHRIDMKNAKKQTFIWMKTLGILILASSLIACYTITIQPERAGAPLSNKPDYEKSHHFFLAGLIGEAEVPVDKICKGRKVLQMQSQTTFLDGLWPFLITMGSVAAAITAGYTLLPSIAGVDLVEPFLFVIGSVIYTPKTAKVWCGEKALDETAKGDF